MSCCFHSPQVHGKEALPPGRSESDVLGVPLAGGMTDWGPWEFCQVLHLAAQHQGPVADSAKETPHGPGHPRSLAVAGAAPAGRAEGGPSLGLGQCDFTCVNQEVCCILT